MVRVAIVEDDDEFASTLEEYVRRYAGETHRAFGIDRYVDGSVFLDGFRGQYQIVFMDVVMPHMNGLETARQLRDRDPNVCLMFITSMAQYAIRGYEVDALDYVLKPLSYDLFRIKFDKALVRVHTDDRFTVVLPGEVRSIDFSRIMYLESDKHYVHIHTADGEFRVRDTIRNLSPRFEGRGFAAIRASILVNMAYVTAASADEVMVNGEHLPIARTYRNDFRRRLTVFMAGGVLP